MKKTSTVRVNGNMIFKGHELTIGLDLRDHWSCYSVLDEAGEILLEQKVATTPEAMKQAFAKIPRSLIARNDAQRLMHGIIELPNEFGPQLNVT
jgi:transposase